MTHQETQAARDFANELRGDVIAIRFNKQRVRATKQLPQRQSDEVCEHFKAKKNSIGTSKKLYDPNQPEIAKINSIVMQAYNAWIDMTIGFHRKGVRLLRKEHLDQFIDCVQAMQTRLDEALAEADANRDEILEAARVFVGDQLFDLNDYPLTFAGSLSLRWSVENVEPSEELLKLAPATYRREQERVRREFEVAIESYEHEAREQLASLVSNLLDKLTPAANGKRKHMTEAATSNLRDFFARFDRLGIKSDADLSALVADARSALGDTTMQQMKKRDDIKQRIAQSFNAVSEKLDSLISDAPARSIDLDELDD